MATRKLPPFFPHRLYAVPGWVKLLEVPRYIVRIDKYVFGRVGTHGWQVRYTRPWAYFGDTVQGKRGTPEASLKTATTYLAAIYAGPPVRVRTTPTSRKLNPIKEAGLRLVTKQRANRNCVEVYVEAVPPAHNLPAKRFYAGTTSTLTLDRLNVALAAARGERAQMVAAHLARPFPWLPLR